jgi:photosystem II stability/assembly factor-like uncharacterized protein
MDEEPSPGISERGRRGLKVILVAALVIVASSLAWLYPTLASKTQPAAPIPTPLPTTPPGDFVTYQFVSPSVGWAAGIAFGSRNPGRYWVARTVDGAKHWETQLRGQVSPRFAGAPAIQFFDKTHGVVAVGVPLELHRTGDGGRSWSTARLPDEEGAFVTFSDSRHGWLLAGTFPTQITPSRLYATNDGGDSWERLPDPPPQPFRIAFRSPQEGWLRTASQSEYGLYLSRDGGQNWQRLGVPDPPGRAQGQNVVVADLRLLPGTGAVVSLGLSDSRGFQLPVHEFTSFDIGRTWTYVPQTQSPDARFLSWDAFEDATHWWRALGANLYKSSDAGQTWKPVPVKLDTGENGRYTIQILDSKHAWAQIGVGQSTGLAVTSDGGLHWIRTNVPEPAS